MRSVIYATSAALITLGTTALLADRVFALPLSQPPIAALAIAGSPIQPAAYTCRRWWKLAWSPLGQKLLACWLRPMRGRFWLQPSLPRNIPPGALGDCRTITGSTAEGRRLICIELTRAAWFNPAVRCAVWREVGRNVEVMWLMCRLVPRHKTIADFRKDNGAASKQVCAQFIELCRSSLE